MVHQFECEGDRWRAARARAESTGGSYEADGIRSAGAVFVHEATGRRLSGRLNPVDVEKPTDNRMREALAARLAESRKKPPFVTATTATNGAKGFTINQEIYVWFERDPTETRPGYVGREVLAVVDEQTVRHDLEKVFAVSSAEIERIIDKAKRNRQQ